jgi:hypothetical protein
LLPEHACHQAPCPEHPDCREPLGLSGAASRNALEPAINGQVSSNGLYPSEDAKRQALGS